MSYTPYDDSIPVAQDALKALKHILQKGEQHPTAADLPDARLHPDMAPLTSQIQWATETALKLLARLSGSEPLQFRDGLDTFADMYARIDAAQAALAEADRNLINGRVDELISLGVGTEGRKAPLPGYALIYGYSLPNIFFHVATAYGILRKEGVPLGKLDYLESFGSRFSPE